LNLYKLLGDFSSVVYDHELSSVDTLPNMNTATTTSGRKSKSSDGKTPLSETSDNIMKEARDRARQAYRAAWQMYLDGKGDIFLPAILGTALNYSVFMVEIDKDVAGGIALARKTFDKVSPTFPITAVSVWLSFNK
jgi:hypothetical protein